MVNWLRPSSDAQEGRHTGHMDCQGEIKNLQGEVEELEERAERLQAITKAQADIIDYYETDHDRGGVPDADIPEELREAELKLKAAGEGENMKEDNQRTVRAALDDAREEIARFQAIVGPIEELRAGDGHTVTIICPNPDGPPNEAVEVSANWTEWETRRFGGATLVEALSKAVEAKRAAAAVKKTT